MWRCTNQTTAQASPCIEQRSPPRISLTALFQLAQWCRQRRSAQQGGDSCRTSPVSVCPPAPNDLGQAATDRTVATAAGRPTAAAPPNVELAGNTTSPSQHGKGGDV